MNKKNKDHNDQKKEENLKQEDSQANSVEQLEKDLAEAKQKIEELTDTYKRSVADFQNFRRRVEEDKKTLITFANTNLILEVLPILDNFERAFSHQPEGVSASWLEGLNQIYAYFKQFLEKQGVQVIKTQGEKYDPNLHEAMLHCAGENGIIAQELEKGYLLNGKVIRPAKVSVGNGS